MVVLDRDVNIIGYKVSSKTKKKKAGRGTLQCPKPGVAHSIDACCEAVFWLWGCSARQHGSHLISLSRAMRWILKVPNHLEDIHLVFLGIVGRPKGSFLVRVRQKNTRIPWSI